MDIYAQIRLAALVGICISFVCLAFAVSMICGAFGNLSSLCGAAQCEPKFLVSVFLAGFGFVMMCITSVMFRTKDATDAYLTLNKRFMSRVQLPTLGPQDDFSNLLIMRAAVVLAGILAPVGALLWATASLTGLDRLLG